MVTIELSSMVEDVEAGEVADIMADKFQISTFYRAQDILVHSMYSVNKNSWQLEHPPGKFHFSSANQAPVKYRLDKNIKHSGASFVTR